MKIKKLYSENTYSFKKLMIDFLEYAGVISIILGKNLDQKTANGAGKTSILKILYWALWNKELNGATVEEMVNQMDPDAGMVSVLEFEDRGYDYKITRYKNYKPHKNSPKLHDGTQVSGSGVEFLVNGAPLMGDSHPKTQLIIEQKLRMTPRLFLSCVLMAQNTKTNFLTANDTEKKELLSELLDLQAYDKAFKHVKDAIKEVEDRISSNENKIETLNEQITHNEDQMVKLTEDEARYVQETDSTLARMALEIKGYENAVIKLKDLASKKDESIEIRQSLQGVETKIKELKNRLSTELQIAQALTTLNNEIKNQESNLLDFTKQVSLKQAKKDELQVLVSQFQVKDFTSVKEELTVKKTLLQKEIKNLKDLTLKEKDLSVSQKELQLNLKSNTAKITDLSLHIKEAQDNALCPTCLRQFKEGENASLDKVIENYQSSVKDLKNQNDAINTELTSLDSLLSKIQEVKVEISQKEQDLKSIEEAISATIEDEQVYKLAQKDKQTYEEQIKNLTTEIEQIKEQETLLIKRNKINIKKQQEVQKLQDDLIPLKSELVNLESSIADKREQLLAAEGISIQIQQAKRELQEKQDLANTVKKNMEELKAKANPYTGMKNSIALQVKTFKDRLQKHKDTVAESQEELKYLNFWKTGFAPIGIRSFITDDVIELLNRKTQENLNDLFDGAISVLFDPESKNNKGIVSNKISTTFIRNGKETSFLLLSGGEQQRCILATELALTEVAEARAGTKLNLRFLDEPFNGIDENGQAKSLSLFARMARDKDGFFIISHDQNFQNLCQKAIFVLKQKDISYVVDKATFNSSSIDTGDDLVAGYKEGENLQLINPTKAKTIDMNKALKKKKEQLDNEDD